MPVVQREVDAAVSSFWAVRTGQRTAPVPQGKRWVESALARRRKSEAEA
jgi:hypothetical protein